MYLMELVQIHLMIVKFAVVSIQGLKIGALMMHHEKLK